MAKKPTYQQLEQKTARLEKDVAELSILKETLRDGRNQYQFLYDFAPVALSEADCSALTKYFETLKKSGKKDFRAYFKKHPEAVADAMDRFKVLSVNKAMVTLLQAKDEKDLLQGFGTIFVEESMQTFIDGLIAFADGKDSFQSEVVMQTFKGNKRTLVLRWSFIPGPQGPKTRMLGSLVDVSELRRTEDELRKFKIASDKTIVGNTISDSGGTITYVNKAFAKMHGYTVKEIVGKHFSFFHTEQQLEEMEGMVSELRKKRNLENVEVWHVRKDGTTFPTISSATVITDKTDGKSFVFTTAIDITDRKNMERELEDNSRSIEEVNIALKVLIDNIQNEKAELEQKLTQKLKLLISPSVDKLSRTRLTREQQKHVDHLREFLENTSLGFSERLTTKYPNLTPAEVQVATLLVNGRTTPEIAALLSTSKRTVEVHRYHLRKKLGLKKKVNLRTFLDSLNV